MIDVKIQPVGRQILLASLAGLKLQAAQKQKAIALVERQEKEIDRLQEEADQLNQISFEMTTNLIDKRFRTSREFVQSGGTVRPNQLQFKKSTTAEQKRIQQLAQMNALKSNTRLNNAVSTYNKRVLNNKVAAEYKRIRGER